MLLDYLHMKKIIEYLLPPLFFNFDILEYEYERQTNLLSNLSSRTKKIESSFMTSSARKKFWLRNPSCTQVEKAFIEGPAKHRGSIVNFKSSLKT